jgi:hypothetical protein
VDVAADARAIWGLLMSSYMNLLLVAVPLGFAAQLLGWSAGLRFGLVRQASEPDRGRLQMATLELELVQSDAVPADIWASSVNVNKAASNAMRHEEYRTGMKWTTELFLSMQNFLALVPLALLLGEVTEDLALRFGDVIGGLLNATFGNVVRIFNPPLLLAGARWSLLVLPKAGLPSPLQLSSARGAEQHRAVHYGLCTKNTRVTHMRLLTSRSHTVFGSRSS